MLLAFDLWISSFLVLFLELACIRWVTSIIRVSAYFSNVVLIGCFLGFGIGCLLRKRQSVFFLLPALLTGFLLLCRFFSTDPAAFSLPSNEFIWGVGGRWSWLWLLPVLYIGVAILFLCIGQKVSQCIDHFSPIKGYTLNLLGSLTGTITFTALAFCGATPTIWFLLSFCCIAWLLRTEKIACLVGCLFLSWAAVTVHHQQQKSLWSPYYKIDLTAPNPSEKGSFSLDVNNDYHQAALNLSSDGILGSPSRAQWQKIYDFPYSIGGTPQKPFWFSVPEQGMMSPQPCAITYRMSSP